jgi:hypothetical protein
VAGVLALTSGDEVLAVLCPASHQDLDDIVRALRRAQALAQVERIQRQDSQAEAAQRRLSLDEIAARIRDLSAAHTS